jgi:hypothetical protein
MQPRAAESSTSAPSKGTVDAQSLTSLLSVLESSAHLLKPAATGSGLGQGAAPTGGSYYAAAGSAMQAGGAPYYHAQAAHQIPMPAAQPQQQQQQQQQQQSVANYGHSQYAMPKPPQLQQPQPPRSYY